MDYERVLQGVRWVLGIVMGLWQAIPELTQLLLSLMAVDFVLGVVAAYHKQELDPEVARAGITKKLGSLLIIGVLALINPYVNQVLNVDLVQAGSAFYLVPELGSIVRNAAILGVPVPEQLKNAMAYFKSVSGEK